MQVMPYRQHVFDSLPPCLSNALKDVVRTTGAPPEIAMILALSSLSVSLRDFDLIAPTDQERMSTQLYCIGIAGKALGKGRSYKALFKAVIDFDARQLDARDGPDSSAGVPSDIFVNEATWSAVFDALDGPSNQVTLVDQDANDFLKGPLMRDVGKLNRFFDSPEKEVKRLRGGIQLRAIRPTLGMCLLVQPDIYAKHLQRRGSDEASVGLLDRILFGVAGQFSSSVPMPGATPSLDLLHAAQMRVLSRGLRRRIAGERIRERLAFSEEAVAVWAQLHSKSTCAAPRMVEKTWRIAALIHVFSVILTKESRLDESTPLPPISAQAVTCAWDVVQWSMIQTAEVLAMLQNATQPSSRIIERRHEEAMSAHYLLRSYLMQVQRDRMPIREAQVVSGLSPYRFEFALKHFVAHRLVERTPEGTLLFSPVFLSTSVEQAQNPPQHQI